MRSKFIVLETEKEVRNEPYVWKGLVLKKYGGEMDDIYYCHLVEDAIKKEFQQGDIVEAELITNNYVPDKDYDYSDFIVEKIRFISKLSWVNLH